MPCTVIPAAQEQDEARRAHPEYKALHKELEEKCKYEEMFCELCRHVLSEGHNNLLLGFLMEKPERLKLWEKHQELDRKAGRSYFTVSSVITLQENENV